MGRQSFIAVAAINVKDADGEPRRVELNQSLIIGILPDDDSGENCRVLTKMCWLLVKGSATEIAEKMDGRQRFFVVCDAAIKKDTKFTKAFVDPNFVVSVFEEESNICHVLLGAMAVRVLGSCDEVVGLLSDGLSEMLM